MDISDQEKSPLAQAGEDLFNFAIDRGDLKELMAYLPQEAAVKRVTVEYELQILKIVMVGWSLSYHLSDTPHHRSLSARYWHAVQEFSRDLSETTTLMVGQDIDYFQILKDRLDTYLNAMHQNAHVSEPAMVIGPEFARICGNKDDVFTVMTGSKMFSLAIGSVKAYLEAVNLR